MLKPFIGLSIQHLSFKVSTDTVCVYFVPIFENLVEKHIYISQSNGEKATDICPKTQYRH